MRRSSVAGWQGNHRSGRSCYSLSLQYLSSCRFASFYWRQLGRNYEANEINNKVVSLPLLKLNWFGCLIARFQDKFGAYLEILFTVQKPIIVLTLLETGWPFFVTLKNQFIFSHCRPGISSLKKQGHFNFAKGTPIGKSSYLWETSVWTLCNSRPDTWNCLKKSCLGRA